MRSEIESTVIGVLMVFVSAILVTIGIVVAETFSYWNGIGIAIGGAIPWGWACFGKPKFYEY